MIVDKFGIEIKIDDIIAYPIEVADTLRLRIGRVVKLAEGKIGVKGVDDSYDFYPKRLCRMGTILYPDRTIVVTGLVPYEYMRLL
jgi:hypothetical protein